MTLYYGLAVTEVDTYTPYSITSATEPNTDQVTMYLEARQGEVHAELRSAGYSIPLTADSDVKLLFLKITQVVAADAYNAAATDAELPAKYRFFYEQWKSFLRAIRKGEYQFESSDPAGADDPAFAITRSPTRDDFWTVRTGDDWDEST